MNEQGFRVPEVCRLVGISYRQLDYWARTGLVRPELKDAQGNIIDADVTDAGFNANLPTLIAYPPEVRRTPAFGYLMPNDDRTFDGRSRLGLDYARGWYFDFAFTLPRDELRKLDRASAFMITPPQARLVSALMQANTAAEMQTSYETAFSTWLQESSEKRFGKGSKPANQMQGILGTGRAGGPPGAGGAPSGGPGGPPLPPGAPPPGVNQLAPGGAGPGPPPPPTQ